MTGAKPSQRIEWIAIDRITIVNPRLRNKKAFKEIVENIAQIGLKRPITVTRRIEADGPFYDLVCGQGRLEAYQALGQLEVPALVVSPIPRIASSPAWSRIARDASTAPSIFFRISVACAIAAIQLPKSGGKPDCRSNMFMASLGFLKKANSDCSVRSRRE